MRIISILLLMLSSSLVLKAQNKDSIDSKIDLQQVVVTAKKVVRKDDHEVIFLSDKNREFGNNALDAVSSLSHFKTDFNANSLLSADRKSVYILINGIPATANELRSYQAEDIKNVEYYPVPPAQYMTVTTGPVANIVLKKKVDSFVSADIYTNNAVNTGFGTNQLGLTYADSLNQVKLNYIIDYRDIHDLSQTSTYNYANQNEYIGKNNKYKGAMQIVEAMYQRNWKKQLFNFGLTLTKDLNKQNEPTAASIMDQGERMSVNSDNILKNKLYSIAANLFYKYSFSDKKSLAFNIVNTYSYSTLDNRIEENSANKVTTETVHFDNHINSLIGNLVYETSFWGAQWDMGDRAEYKKLNQHNLGNTESSSSTSNFLYLGMNKRLNRFRIHPTVGVNYVKTKTEERNTHNTIPYLRLYTDWWGEGKLEGFSVQMTTLVNTVSPTSAQLTQSPTYQERNLVSIGNPLLKPYWQGGITLYLLYFGKNDNYFNFSYAPSIAHHPFATTLYIQDGMAISQPQQISNVVKHNLSVTGSWHPFSWLEIAPYIEYYHTSYNTLVQHICLPYWRFGGGITFPMKHWEIGLYANSPTKEAEGDLIEHGSAQYAAKMQYKYRNWSFGLEYHYSGHNEYTIGTSKDFNYKKLMDWKPLHNLIQITASYSLSRGKQHEHEGKTLYNESDDYGFTKGNTTKKPQ